MGIEEMRTLFLTHLATMYDGELQLLDILVCLAKETAPGEASELFTTHATETERHVENLRRCFQLLEEEPFCVVNHAVRGLSQDHDAFAALGPSPSALTAFDLASAAKTEQLEIASYIGLLRDAGLHGDQELVALLTENLRNEQRTARKVDSLSTEIARAAASESGRRLEGDAWTGHAEVVVSPAVAQEGVSPFSNEAGRGRSGPSAGREGRDDESDEIPDRGGAT